MVSLRNFRVTALDLYTAYRADCCTLNQREIAGLKSAEMFFFYYFEKTFAID
jgi:hypothetical protein